MGLEKDIDQVNQLLPSSCSEFITITRKEHLKTFTLRLKTLGSQTVEQFGVTGVNKHDMFMPKRNWNNT